MSENEIYKKTITELVNKSIDSILRTKVMYQSENV